MNLCNAEAGAAVAARRQRFDLSVRGFPRLQPGAEPRAHQSTPTRHQFCRRRTESTRIGHHGAGNQTRAARPLYFASGQRGNQRPRHDQPSQMVETSSSGISSPSGTSCEIDHSSRLIHPRKRRSRRRSRARVLNLDILAQSELGQRWDPGFESQVFAITPSRS